MNNIFKKLIESFKNITKHGKDLGEGFGFVTKTTTALMTTILGAAKSVKNFGDNLASIGNESFANLSKSSNELLASFKNVKDFLSTKFIQFSNWTQGKENKEVNYTDGMNKVQLQTYSDLRKTGLISDTDNASWIANAYNKLKSLGYDELDANGRLSSLAQKAMNISNEHGIGDINGVLNALLEMNTTGKTDALTQYGIGFNEDFYKAWLYEQGYNPNTTFTDSKQSQLMDEALAAYMQMNDYEINAMKQLGFEINKATNAIQAWEEVENIGSFDNEMGSTRYEDLSNSLKSLNTKDKYEALQKIEELERQEAIANSELQAIKNNTGRTVDSLSNALSKNFSISGLQMFGPLNASGESILSDKSKNFANYAASIFEQAKEKGLAHSNEVKVDISLNSALLDAKIESTAKKTTYDALNSMTNKNTNGTGYKANFRK